MRRSLGVLFPTPDSTTSGSVGRPLRLPQSGVARGKRGACPTGRQGRVGCAKVFGCSVPAPGFNHPGVCRATASVASSGVARGKRGACPPRCQGRVGCAKVFGCSVPAPDSTTPGSVGRPLRLPQSEPHAASGALALQAPVETPVPRCRHPCLAKWSTEFFNSVRPARWLFSGWNCTAMTRSVTMPLANSPA